MSAARLPRFRCVLCALCVLCVGAAAQEPAAPQAISPEQLTAAIDKLGDLDYATRTNASRTVRRTPANQAVPALLRAVSEHSDGYVRYRALVLLTGFNDPRTKDAMREAIASPNDRLRAAAYGYFEHHPDPDMLPAFLAALDKEQAEFVRPAVVRALAAQGTDPRVRVVLLNEAGRGQDYFRSAVIEALGDYKAAYAVDALMAIAKLDGPLVEDAAIALGKIGDKKALDVLAAAQRTAPRRAQPSIAAAICLLGVNCGSHENYLVETLKFADKNIGYQELLRGSASGLGALGVNGNAEAVAALFDVGIPSRDPTRAPIALALGKIALRNTPMILTALSTRDDRDAAISLLGEGFDMLEEDLEKERFFAAVRRAYWDADAGSASRQLTGTLIRKLDF
jgi:HEAT repeat protein